MPDSASVGFVGEPRIADHQHAAIGLGTDQASGALFEADRRLRKLPVEERIAALGPELVEPRREQRIVRRRERQLVDHDDRQRITGNVDAFPEARAAQQDGVAQRAKSRQELGLRAVALHEQRIVEPMAYEGFDETVACCGERAQRREQHECASATCLQDRQRGIHDSVGMLACVRWRKVARHI